MISFHHPPVENACFGIHPQFGCSVFAAVFFSTLVYLHPTQASFEGWVYFCEKQQLNDLCCSPFFSKYCAFWTCKFVVCPLYYPLT